MSRSLRWLAALCALLLVAGCASSGKRSSTRTRAARAKPPPTAPAEPKRPAVFAEPAGALCARRNAGNLCVEPTSSSAGLAALLAMLRNPAGELVQMRRTSTWMAALPPAGGDGRAAPGRSTFSTASRTLVFGQNRIRFDGRIYVAAGTSADGALEFQAADNDIVRVHAARADAGVPVEFVRSGVAGSADPIEERWSTRLEPLTDRRGLAADADGMLRFDGVLAWTGAAARAAARGTSGQPAQADCPVSFVLDAGSGALTAAVRDCRGNAGESLAIDLPALTVALSRIDAPRDRRAGVRTVAREGEASGGGLLWQSSGIVGEITGADARNLILHGAGEQGAFVVAATRRRAGR